MLFLLPEYVGKGGYVVGVSDASPPSPNIPRPRGGLCAGVSGVGGNPWLEGVVWMCRNMWT